MQLLLQFPCHFEFNLTYLLKLAEHTYSNLFGNFLVNNLAERRRLKIKERTRSIWGYLRSHPSKFRNFLFVRRDEVLWARCEVRDLLLWQDVYMGESSASQIIKEVTSSPSANGSVEETDSGNDREEEDEEDKLQVVPGLLCSVLFNVSSCQNGSKESTPDVCPEYRRDSSSEESSSTEQYPTFPGEDPLPQVNGNGHIEKSTDTLVPETEVQSRVEVRTPKTSSTVLPEVRRTELAVSLPLPGRVDVSESPLDSDGLVAHQDQVQRRMVEIFASHQAELNALRRDLHVSRLALTQAGLKPEQILEETQDVMLDGRSGVDSTASEVSWEALEDAETRPTLWVPDHAATSCMGCNTQFWFGRRKHHCRWAGERDAIL